MEQSLSPEKIKLLLLRGNGDAALLYLWLCSDRALPCPLSGAALEEASAILRSLGLMDAPKKAPLRQETRPTYSERDVEKGLQREEFVRLQGEVQRILGRILSTEELKCLLSIRDYLHMEPEVISILVSYCNQRSRQRSNRPVSLRAVEKEAYRWADAGVDDVETAVRFVREQLARQSRKGRIAAMLQLHGRKLVQDEENFIDQWLSWGFPDEAIQLAYEKTCLNAGGLKWAYMHSILRSWHEKGLHTVAQIRQGDGAGKKPAEQKRTVSDFEREAVRKLMEREG